MIEPDLAARAWPRPLPVVLAPARDEALSSWLARHAAFYGLSITTMRRYCVPDAVSLPALDRHLTPDQEARLAHLFRRDRVAIREMTQAPLDSALSLLAAHDVDHWCEPCARSLAEAAFPKAVLRAWFHTWRITCARCGARVSPPWRALAGDGGISALPDLFPHLWAKALQGERLLATAVHRSASADTLIPPMRLLRLLMIQAGCERIPADGERQGWTLDAVVPGFDAALEQHGIVIPRTTLVNLPLPVRTALLAGFALATEDPETAIKAMWATTFGMHRAHFRYVLTDMPGGHRFRSWIAARPSSEERSRSHGEPQQPAQTAPVSVPATARQQPSRSTRPHAPTQAIGHQLSLSFAANLRLSTP